ncbi:protein max isoform X3 [Xenopus laevis]|uniref:Protein max n=1 Tax=Xenopus laevis TaxID=8355 RepID=A0A8J1LLH1_XENLA|nr:protein max isoform X3 [Xenopus laevis]
MSDNDDIEVESDADKRAHHNALERKRRDHIKDSFHGLRDSVPSLQGEKASRAQILDKATEYIQYMRRKNHTHQQDIDDLKRQNALLEQQEHHVQVKNPLMFSFNPVQISNPKPPSNGAPEQKNVLQLLSPSKVRALEKAKSSSQLQSNYSSSESETEEPQSRKKLRMDAS